MILSINTFLSLNISPLKKEKKTKPVKNHVKIIDLLRHSAGLNFKGPDDYRKVIDLSLEEYTKESIKSPLKFEPGTTWWYSYATDICGYLIEVLSQEKLDVFLKSRIFDPLEMNDTFFELPNSKLDRLTTLYVRRLKTRSLFHLTIKLIRHLRTK
jgi:CubicO group peptidase (beta-lactamase class C family)